MADVVSERTALERMQRTMYFAIGIATIIFGLLLAPTDSGFIGQADQVNKPFLIFSIAVAPGCQGQGLGIELLQFLDGKAAEWGLPEVRLYTNSRMKRNIALYRAYGFQETGRRPNPYRPGWTLVDMTKSIED